MFLLIWNLEAKSKTSKRDLKRQSVIQNVQAQAETLKAWAEKSKRKPKHQSISQNVEMRTGKMQAKTVKSELKRWEAS